VQMNIMGNVKEPFLSQDRFQVTFSQSAPRYGFHLLIAGRLYVTVSLNYRLFSAFIHSDATRLGL